MTVSRTYLMRVLQRMEERLTEEGHRQEATLVAQITSHLSLSPDIGSELDRLHAVDGFEQLSLALMWIWSNRQGLMNGNQQEILGYDAETLYRTVLPDQDESEDRPSKPPGAGTLRLTLQEFSRLVADIRRRAVASGRGRALPEDQLWRIITALEGLRLSAVREAEADVVSFCDALGIFVEFVIDHHLYSDPRVLGLIDNANLTLQTVVGGNIPEERGSLQQTIELLKHPSAFLEFETGGQ